MNQLKQPQKTIIVDFEPQYRADFEQLNREWIEKYFEMEDTDRKYLQKPQELIIDKGGRIFIALLNDKVVGVCSLIPFNDQQYNFELAKMAVSPKVQGKGIGFLLGNHALQAAKGMNAKGVYLETNSILQPAIRLYKKLGFQMLSDFPTPYMRCNTQMGVVFQ